MGGDRRSCAEGEVDDRMRRFADEKEGDGDATEVMVSRTEMYGLKADRELVG